MPAAFTQKFPAAKIDWLVRSDFKALLTSHPLLERIIAFDRSEGLWSLMKLAWRLGAEPYTHIFDAHNNLRSNVVSLVIGVRRFIRAKHQPLPRFLRRSKDRIRRFLFFRARLRQALKMPFRGIESFLKPLRRWGISTATPHAPQFFIGESDKTLASRMLSDFSADVALVPSAAWEMKRWPVEYWRELINLMPDTKFAVLGGPEDGFCAELEAIAPNRVRNFAGKLSLQGSAALIEKARVVVANDTGLLHVADQLGRPTIALIGPTAFGYPSHPKSEALEIALPCKPCSKDGRGVCVNAIYKKCLLEVSPARVAERIRAKLSSERMS